MYASGISRRSFAKSAVGLLAGSILTGTFAGSGNEPQLPNIIIFLVDDLGLMDASVPMLTDADGNPKRHPLNDWYRTPSLERLAARGMRFSNFYAHSVCSPSRVTILTGQNSARHTTTQWIHPTSKNTGEFGPSDWNWKGLKGDEPTLPRLLKDKGYRTIHVGKAHFGPQDKPGSEPLNLGFDVNIGGTFTGAPGSYYGEDGYGYIRGPRPRGNRLRAVPHLEEYHGTDTFLTEALTLEANKQIEDAVSEGKPFFLHMSHYAVHTPFQIDPRFADNYEHCKEFPRLRAYSTLVEGVDKSLGDIMDKVESLGVAENTFIVFLGDNGSDAPLGPVHEHGSSAPLRGKKGTHFEGGTRVPFVASWIRPDEGNRFQRRLPIISGHIHTQMGSIMDLMPTISNLVGIRAPDSHVVDGFDLKKQLSARENPKRANFFINHFPHRHRSSYYTSYVKDDWKLIYFYPVADDVEHMLFKVSEDPYEKNNLAESQPEQLNSMIASLRAELEAYGALYPVRDGRELRLPGAGE